MPKFQRMTPAISIAQVPQSGRLAYPRVGGELIQAPQESDSTSRAPPVDPPRRQETELQQADKCLAAQVRELARSNSELEQLASTVSHDLRSPLFTLSGCAQLLVEQHANDLPPEARELIGYIQDSAHHMLRLINRLLEYARVEHGSLKSAQCDANSALRTALEGLKSDLNGTAGSVTADTLPIVRADETLLGQLFQNLIENAIKYRGAVAPRIHVSASQDPGFWTFAVSDNGIGIDPQYFDQIFRAFGRLTSAKPQCPGLGIGLATCKKIAERHGGRIWVASQPGHGATFFFSLARRSCR